MTSHETPLSIRALGKLSFRTFLELTSKGLDIEGKENLPNTPPFFIAFNHYGWVEGLLPYIVLPLKNWPYTMTKIENMQGVLGKVLSPLGVFGVHRGEVDRTALTTAANHLKRGHVVVTAPEGTRGRGEERLQMKKARAGVVYIAKLLANDTL